MQHFDIGCQTEQLLVLTSYIFVFFSFPSDFTQ
ncbi:Uncharacterised protein [Vibrio cholerae]|uniref:Uncharacterized protein n=1 Tax=Vibrio cholerae TaxID=666 RepID=A0A656AVJ4_VIBCL|nr:Uncharacterised protein [Vibrio cholerae]